MHGSLQILHANSNSFSGSIPVHVKEMSELNELFLHNNELFGTLSSEIGNLGNMSKITISYNNIKGSIPTEIGNLRQLKLLHLHGNALTGNADYFDSYTIQSFISDCGNTATTASLVKCETCTDCCNREEECITETKSWPRHTIKNFNSSLKVSSAVSVFILTFLSGLSMIFVTMLLHLFKDMLPKSTYVRSGDQFQKASF